MDLDPFDQATDGVEGFSPGRLVFEQGLQLADLAAVELSNIGMDLDRLVRWFRCELVLKVVLACLKLVQCCGNGARIAVALGDKGEAPLDAALDLRKVPGQLLVPGTVGPVQPLQFLLECSGELFDEIFAHEKYLP